MTPDVCAKMCLRLGRFQSKHGSILGPITGTNCCDWPMIHLCASRTRARARLPWLPLSGPSTSKDPSAGLAAPSPRGSRNLRRDLHRPVWPCSKNRENTNNRSCYSCFPVLFALIEGTNICIIIHLMSLDLFLEHLANSGVPAISGPETSKKEASHKEHASKSNVYIYIYA